MDKVTIVDRILVVLVNITSVNFSLELNIRFMTNIFASII